MTDEETAFPVRCPWCGGYARVRAYTGGDSVECDRCHASGPMTMFGPRAAIRAWNNVAACVDPAAPRDVERNAAGADCVVLEGEIKHLRRSLNRAYEINDSYRDSHAALERSHERMRRVHEATAEHLRKARRELRETRARLDTTLEHFAVLAKDHSDLVCDLRAAELTSIIPAHYRGDGIVSAARALRSATAQSTKTERTEGGFYWWALAFKYVWRLWSKGQADSDAKKAIDCLKRVIWELDEGEEA